MDPDRAPVPCPPDDMLGALVDRALDCEELARVTAHLDECAGCLQIVIAAVRGGVARPHPLAVIELPGAARAGPAGKPRRPRARD